MRDSDRDDVAPNSEVYFERGLCRRILVTPNHLWCHPPAPDRPAKRLHRNDGPPSGKTSQLTVAGTLIVLVLFALAFALLYLHQYNGDAGAKPGLQRPPSKPAAFDPGPIDRR